MFHKADRLGHSKMSTFIVGVLLVDYVFWHLWQEMKPGPFCSLEAVSRIAGWPGLDFDANDIVYSIELRDCHLTIRLNEIV